MTLGAAISESAIARAVLPWRCFGSRELTLGAAPAKKARFQLLLRVTVFRSTRWDGLWGQAVEAASLQSGSGRTGLGAHGPAVGVSFCPLWGSWTGWLLRVPPTQALLFCSPMLCGRSSGREAVVQPVYVKKKTPFQKEKIQY